jgi:hypothetical protein
MSRSFKKYPLTRAQSSLKWAKQHASRALRHRVKQMIYQGKMIRGVLPIPNEIYDMQWSAMDGCFRFDPKEFPELMRK